jgi:hypothetical protein
MAKRRTRSARSTGLAPGRRNATQIHADIRELESRVADLDAFDPAAIKSGSDPAIRALELSIRNTLSNIFSRGTSRYRMFQSATRLDPGGVTASGSTPRAELVQGLQHGKGRALERPRQAIQTLRGDLAELQAEATAPGLEPRLSNATVEPDWTPELEGPGQAGPWMRNFANLERHTDLPPEASHDGLSVGDEPDPVLERGFLITPPRRTGRRQARHRRKSPGRTTPDSRWDGSMIRVSPSTGPPMSREPGARQYMSSAITGTHCSRSPKNPHRLLT